MVQDLRCGMRRLRSSPGFVAMAMVSLAFGIGINTAVFSAIDAALLRPLPYADPDRVVMLWEDGSRLGLGKDWPSPGNYGEWKRRNHVFAGMTALLSVSANLTGDGPAEQLFGRRVSADFFSVMGVHPIVGRAFTAEEENLRASVAVISYGLWQRRYAADPNIAGRQIRLDGNAITVIGVMPREFAFQRRDVSCWLPASFSAADLQNRKSHALHVVARLNPGVSLESAQNDMRTVAAEMSAEYPEDRRLGVSVVPVKDELLGSARTELLVLLAGAGCVLLIACANLASLLLERTMARHREIAIRMALGAGRGRLVRQIAMEGLLLGAAGGLLGAICAAPGIRLLTKLVPETLPPSAAPQANARLLVFTILLSLATGLLFSVVPALHIAWKAPILGLKQDSRTGSGTRESRVRGALVVMEVALALVLLAGAGLLVQTLVNMNALNLGFRSSHLLTLRTVLPPKYRDSAARRAFANRVMEGVRALPGVTGTAYVSTLPFESRGDTARYQVEGRQLDRNDPGDALYRVVSNEYLQLMGARLIEGRWFDRGDGPETGRVVLVSESFARKYWRNESALGHRISISDSGAAAWSTVAGVVRDLRECGYETAIRPAIYQPSVQAIRQTRDLVVRTAGDPLAVAPGVRRVIAAIDPEQPVAWVRTMDEMIDSTVAGRRQVLLLLAMFAALALILAIIGLYGILSTAVTRRSRELGLRMALGATAAGVQRMVISHGLTLTGVGLGIGLMGCWTLTRLMKSILYGVDAIDPATFATVAALLGGVAIAACWIPARRASRLDPMTVLREE
jgi:predicted permease